MNTSDYLSAVKAKLNITSDYALAKALGVSRQRASDYVLGKSVPATLVAFTIAEILGEQPAGVIAELELERAEKMAKEGDVELWKARLRRLGGAAASILLGALMLGQPNGGAASELSAHIDASIHRIKRRRKKKASPWSGLLCV
jgi:transcriptional regulator with XRE-family HTH domain